MRDLYRQRISAPEIGLWRKCWLNLNQFVRVLDQNDPYEGIARGIKCRAESLVERADGTVEEVIPERFLYVVYTAMCKTCSTDRIKFPAAIFR